jgi:hypothetical protein
VFVEHRLLDETFWSSASATRSFKVGIRLATTNYVSGFCWQCDTRDMFTTTTQLSGFRRVGSGNLSIQSLVLQPTLLVRSGFDSNRHDHRSSVYRVVVALSELGQKLAGCRLRNPDSAAACGLMRCKTEWWSFAFMIWKCPISRFPAVEFPTEEMHRCRRKVLVLCR